MKPASRNLTLIHRRTHQRYPLHGNLVIGRASGDLVFDHDPKLSSKHCLIRETDQGPAIYDLKSRTGVFVNGAHLPADKACLLKAGCRITVGDQMFEVRDNEGSAFESLLRLRLVVAAMAAAAVTMALILAMAHRSPTKISAVVPAPEFVQK